MINYKNDNFIIYGQFELVSGGTSRALLPGRGIGQSELVSEYVFAAGQQMQTSTFVCPMAVARKIMFDSTLTRHQDSDFMMRAQANDIVLIFQNEKCASYFFNSVDMLSRINSGQVNEKFCLDWLKSKSEFFNSRAVAGYKIIVFSRILFLQGNKIRAFLMILKSLPKLGINNFIDLVRSKMKIAFGSRFFNVR